MKTSCIASHVLVLRPKHDKMWTGCAWGSSSKNILKQKKCDDASVLRWNLKIKPCLLINTLLKGRKTHMWMVIIDH
jgi:hypothetical protein